MGTDNFENVRTFRSRGTLSVDWKSSESSETASKLTEKPKSQVEIDCDHNILSVPLEPVYY